MSAWTYEGYWATVLGERSAEQVVVDFGLSPSTAGDTIDEWLGGAEAEAWRVGAKGGPIPASWAAFHTRALVELESAAVGT